MIFQIIRNSLRYAANSSNALKKKIEIDERDIVEKFVVGSGNGGQAMQKTNNCVQLHHLPSGIRINCHDTRSREQNRKIARKRLSEKLDFIENGRLSKIAQEIAKERRRNAKYAKRSAEKHQNGSGKSGGQGGGGKYELIISGQYHLSYRNSLDANASLVDIELVDFGFESIKITDNGSGIGCLDHIAKPSCTSKMRRAEDLKRVSTFGFRGEALHAISNCCKFLKISSKLASETVGRSCVITDGKREHESVAMNTGTSVVVEQLLFNLPVRRQEAYKHRQNVPQQIRNLIDHYWVCHHGVKFILKFLHCNKQLSKKVVTRPVVPSQQDALKLINGPLLSHHMTNISHSLSVQSGCYKVDLYVPKFDSTPSVVSKTKAEDAHFVYLNGRPVDMPFVPKILREQYKSVDDRFNVTRKLFIVAQFQIPLDVFDINLDPSKESVLFHDQDAVEKLVVDAIQTEIAQYRRSAQSKQPIHQKSVVDAVMSVDVEIASPRVVQAPQSVSTALSHTLTINADQLETQCCNYLKNIYSEEVSKSPQQIVGTFNDIVVIEQSTKKLKCFKISDLLVQQFQHYGSNLKISDIQSCSIVIKKEDVEPELWDFMQLIKGDNQFQQFMAKEGFQFSFQDQLVCVTACPANQSASASNNFINQVKKWMECWPYTANLCEHAILSQDQIQHQVLNILREISGMTTVSQKIAYLNQLIRTSTTELNVTSYDLTTL
ncbi:hypothetical protein MIR68_003019 [Amoeboaphelidium protococcarum]|nr:hypothetical protein MIR68_003019 [Amoeboaphelidium protococcarum]